MSARSSEMEAAVPIKFKIAYSSQIVLRLEF